MNVCLCFGPNWAKYVAVELHSMFKHNKVSKVYLMSEKVPHEDKMSILAICEENGVEMIYIDMEAWEKTHLRSKKNIDNRFTKYTLYRLAIPDMVPEDKVLYLDADTLVVGNVEDFYNTPLDSSKVIAGCIDTGIGAAHKRKIGSPANSTYLNAGVLLMNLDEIRKLGVNRQWLRMMADKHYPAHDQDIIHLTLNGKFEVVSPIYNASVSTACDIPDEEVRIVHYAGDKSTNWVYSIPKANLFLKAETDYKNYLSSTVKETPQRINKVLAYCWFGKGPKPPKIQQCVDSWKKFCPDWKIIELNEDNCNVDIVPFVAGAFKAKKYAFVADYFRLQAMYELGCVTVDADVELIKGIDCFLHHRMFSGQEIDGQVLITALMGSEKKHPVVKKMIEYYDTAVWHDRYDVPNTRWITELFKPLIKSKLSDGSLVLEDEVHLYPKYYFCNYDHKKRKLIPDVRSYSIHWFNASWKK